MDLIFAIRANDCEIFVNRVDTSRGEGMPKMLRRTIVLAKTVALNSAPTVETFAHGDAVSMHGSRVKLIALTSQTAALFNSLGNVEAVLPARALAKRLIDHGAKAADDTPVGPALRRASEQGLEVR